MALVSSIIYEDKTISDLQTLVDAAIAALSSTYLVDFELDVFWRNHQEVFRVKLTLDDVGPTITGLTLGTYKTKAAANTAIAAWVIAGATPPEGLGTPKMHNYKFRGHPNRVFTALPTTLSFGDVVYSPAVADYIEVDTTATLDQSEIYLTSHATPFTLTLPTPVGVAGTKFTVHMDDGSLGQVTLDSTAGSFSIDDRADTATILLSSNANANQVIVVQSDGTNWVVQSNTHTPDDSVSSVLTAVSATLAITSDMRHIYLTDATAGAFAATLPTAVGAEGAIHTIHLDDGHTAQITLSADGVELISREGLLGATDYLLSTSANANQVITVQSDNVGWVVQSDTWNDSHAPVAVAETTTLAILHSMEHIYLSDPTAGAFNATLPTPVGCTGRKFTIHLDTSPTAQITLVTPAGIITRNGILGTTDYLLSTATHANQVVEIQSDGTNWIVISDTHTLEDPYTAATNAASVVDHTQRHIYLTSTAAGGAFAAVLPTAVGCNGALFTFYLDVGNVHAVTLEGNGAELIYSADTAGNNSFALSVHATCNQVVTLRSNNVAWMVISNTH